jgi:hypothetical protein
MQSNFELACKSARELIAVPPTPLGAIRAAKDNRPEARKHRPVLVATLLAGASIVAAAAAAEIFSTHVSYTQPGSMHLTFDSAGDNKTDPTDADFRAVARHLNFTLVVPVGLPAGTVAKHFTRFDSDALLVSYDLPGAWRRSNHVLTVLLANKNVAAPPASAKRSKGEILMPGQHQDIRGVIGNERLDLMSNTLTPAEIATIKRAMAAAAR